MASVILVLIIAVLILYKLYKYMTYRPSNFPPGPPRIPFIGGYIWLLLANYNRLEIAVDVLCKYYKTNILGLYLANFPTICLNDADTVKDSLFHRDFDGKPVTLLAKLRDPNLQIRGIFFTDGPLWKNQRRFALRHLRDYGFGRRFSELEIEIGEEISILIDLIRNGPTYEHEKKYVQNGKILCPEIFSACPSNAFLKILCNERWSRKDFGALYSVAKEGFIFQKHSDSFGRLFSLIECTGPIFPKLTGYDVIRNSSMKMFDFMKKIIDEQIATHDANHDRSILDMYIREMKEAKCNNDVSFFSYEQLISICVDFLLPPLTAIPVTLAFIFHKLVLHPEVQERIHKEIDDVVGQGRLPTLDDRINLPYTEATIRETMRMETLVPNGLPHRSVEDTSFRGYDIPKDTIIMPVLNASHMDSMKWKDSLEFRPERMLDDTGKLSLQKDYSLPFGAGKRLCAGETFARNVLFLMCSALLQNFNVKEVVDSPLPTQPITGLIKFFPDFYLNLEQR